MLKSINNILEKGFVFTRKQSNSKLARHIQYMNVIMFIFCNVFVCEHMYVNICGESCIYMYTPVCVCVHACLYLCTFMFIHFCFYHIQLLFYYHNAIVAIFVLLSFIVILLFCFYFLVKLFVMFVLTGAI